MAVVDGPGKPPPGARRARTATSLLFFLTGAVFATWAARIPAIQERLDLSPGELSIALLAVEAGALAGLSVAGRLVAGIGSPRSLRLGFALFPPALLAAALAPSLALLAAGLIVMGAANSVIDVAMNTQGIELERRYRRPVLSGLHSGHSFGVLAGGLAGTVLAARGAPVLTHFAAMAALGVCAGQAAAAALQNGATTRAKTAPNAATARAPATPRRPPRSLALLGLLAFCAFFVEGAASDWSAVDLRSTHGATPALAAGAFTAFSLMLALGRLAGDRVVGRWGRPRSLRAAALLAAAGAAVVVCAWSAPAALAGWAILGTGTAAIAPTLLGAAPAASCAPPPVAIATVSMIGYAGSFTGPPLIGALAQVTSLRAALGLLAVGAIAIAALAARPFRPDRRSDRPDCARIATVLRSITANDLP